jgi:hypothetical protein
MKNRAYLLPVVLIVLGVLALVVNVGAIPTDRLYRLADLWPVLAIVLGLEILINSARLPSSVETTASVLVVVIALAGAGLYVALGPAVPSGTHTMTSRAPVAGLTKATLEVDAGATELDVEGGSTGPVSDLFQAQITYSGPQPTVSVDRSTGRVVVKQNGRFGYFGDQAFHMDIQLNVAVSWSFEIRTGASSDKYVLSSARLRSLEIDTGASTEDITLGHPSGEVPVRINGGTLTVHLHRPPGIAASVKVSGGAVTLQFDGQRSGGIGTVSHSTGSAEDMFNVNVSGGTCAVSMDAALD